jgi:hypothetical protein
MNIDTSKNRTLGVDLSGKNRQVLIRSGLMLALTLVLASNAPAGLVAATISGLTLMAAMVVLMFALLVGERIGSPHLTRWDECAAMLGVSLAAGFLVDPVALEAAIAEAAAERGAE